MKPAIFAILFLVISLVATEAHKELHAEVLESAFKKLGKHEVEATNIFQRLWGKLDGAYQHPHQPLEGKERGDNGAGREDAGEPIDASRAPACSDLSGYWYNQLGSELYVAKHNKTDGALTGEYRTAVESRTGDAGEGTFRLVHGKVSTFEDAAGSMVSMTVHYPRSVAGWTGQCLPCPETGDTLHTTWILTALAEECGEAWGSTRVGTDTFTRSEQKMGPRRNDEQENGGIASLFT